jgi:uncharacterized protein YneF (UPF0154 family)
MWRAVLILGIVLGIVIGSLMVLRRTANMNPPIPKEKLRPPGQDDAEEDENSGW